MAIPAPMPEPPPVPPGEKSLALDTDGETPAAEEEPKPLHTSPAELRVDGDAAWTAGFFGATELANTDCPPRLVTPAVAPDTRAANCEDTEGAAAPALLPPLLPLDPPVLAELRLPPVAPLV